MKKILLFIFLLPLLASGQDSLFTNSMLPASVVPDPQPVELGIQFKSDRTGTITHIRFYKGTSEVRAFSCKLYDANGVLLAAKDYTATAIGWHRVPLDQPVEIRKNQLYTASVYSAGGSWPATFNMLAPGYSRPPLTIIPNGGRYKYGNAFPDVVSSTNYWIDIIHKSYPVDTVFVGDAVNIYVPRDGGWAKTDDADTSYKALFGIFPPPYNSPHIYRFNYSSFRLTLYKNGAWIRERYLNGKWSIVQYSTF